jgi:hypothetical protein
MEEVNEKIRNLIIDVTEHHKIIMHLLLDDLKKICDKENFNENMENLRKQYLTQIYLGQPSITNLPITSPSVIEPSISELRSMTPINNGNNEQKIEEQSVKEIPETKEIENKDSLEIDRDTSTVLPNDVIKQQEADNAAAKEADSLEIAIDTSTVLSNDVITQKTAKEAAEEQAAKEAAADKAAAKEAAAKEAAAKEAAADKAAADKAENNNLQKVEEKLEDIKTNLNGLSNLKTVIKEIPENFKKYHNSIQNSTDNILSNLDTQMGEMNNLLLEAKKYPNEKDKIRLEEIEKEFNQYIQIVKLTNMLRYMTKYISEDIKEQYTLQPTIKYTQ